MGGSARRPTRAAAADYRRCRRFQLPHPRAESSTAVQPYHDELAGARLLTSHDVIVSTIATTTIPAGLTVRAGLDSGTYPEGIKVSDEQMAALPTARHDWHGD